MREEKESPEALLLLPAARHVLCAARRSRAEIANLITGTHGVRGDKRIDEIEALAAARGAYVIARRGGVCLSPSSARPETALIRHAECIAGRNPPRLCDTARGLLPLALYLFDGRRRRQQRVFISAAEFPRSINLPVIRRRKIKGAGGIHGDELSVLLAVVVVG